MAIGSGLSAQLMLAEESTWGTRVAPNRSFYMNSESLGLEYDYLASAGLGAGSRAPRADRQTRVNQTVTGDVELEVASKGFGVLGKHMLGTVTTFTPSGATLARVHRCQLGNLGAKSLTVQVGKPSTDQVVNPFEYTGCKINTWELANSVGEYLMLTLGLDGAVEDTAQTIGTFAPPSGLVPLHFGGGVINLGGTPSISGTAIVGVTGGTNTSEITDISISGDNGLAVDRRFIRASLAKSEQIQQGLVNITGSMDMEFASMTVYNRFTSGTTYCLYAKWESTSVIELSTKFGIHVLIPAIRPEGETPKVDGADILTMTQPFTALDDNTNPVITIDVVTTDTAP